MECTSPARSAAKAPGSRFEPIPPMTPAVNKALPELEALATSGVKFTPQAFLGKVGAWIVVDRSKGKDAIERVYRATLEGRADPRKGYVLAPGEGR